MQVVVAWYRSLLLCVVWCVGRRRRCCVIVAVAAGRCLLFVVACLLFVVSCMLIGIVAVGVVDAIVCWLLLVCCLSVG